MVIRLLLPEGLPVGKFFRQALRTFHCFSDFCIKIVMIMRHRVALGLTLNICQVYLRLVRQCLIQTSLESSESLLSVWELEVS